MSKKIFCDPKLRAVGKPLVGRAIGTFVGTAIGCSASGKNCSPAKQILSTLVTATIGYSIGAIWDAACKQE